MTKAFFHGLSPAQHERYTMLAEEAGEIVVAVNKILRHGPDSHNPDRPQDGPNHAQLTEEVAQLVAVFREMVRSGDVIQATTEQIRDAWRRKLIYSHHQGR